MKKETIRKELKHKYMTSRIVNSRDTKHKVVSPETKQKNVDEKD